MDSLLEESIAACEREAGELRQRLKQMESGTYDYGGLVDAKAYIREERTKLIKLEKHIEALKASRG